MKPLLTSRARCYKWWHSGHTLEKSKRTTSEKLNFCLQERLSVIVTEKQQDRIIYDELFKFTFICNIYDYFLDLLSMHRHGQYFKTDFGMVTRCFGVISAHRWKKRVWPNACLTVLSIRNSLSLKAVLYLWMTSLLWQNICRFFQIVTFVELFVNICAVCMELF